MEYPYVHVVNEIPKFTNAKKEINKEEKYNPIKHDIKKGEVRFVTNLFPSKGYIWNYGAIPQTWESTYDKDKKEGYTGDNDPIDAIEIGSAVKSVGEVYTAKIVGALAMIDSGELDWKILVISNTDEKYNIINDISDIEKHMPGLLEETRAWFRNYKLPAGGKKNKFMFEGKYLTAKEAIQVVEETHQHWKKLIREKEHEGISLVNTTQEETPGYTTVPFDLPNRPYTPRMEPLQAHAFFYLTKSQKQE